MSATEFLIQVPMADGKPFDLCRCTTSYSAAEVVRALLDANGNRPLYVTVLPVPAICPPL